MFNRRGKPKILQLALILLFLIISSSNSYAEPEVKKIITVAGDENFPPYEFLDERDGLKVYRGLYFD